MLKKLILTRIRQFSVGLIILLFAGIICEQVIQFYLDSKRPGPEQFCEINGANIHFIKKGSGGPTVVFQSGLGGDHKIWQNIQDSLSLVTTTIAYDRAGLQWSDRSGAEKTLESIKSELFELLEKTNCPKPYILVGHSLAGITLRPFVRDYGKDICGVVLLDASHPLDIKKSSDALKQYTQAPPAWLLTALMETGIGRLYFTFQPFITDIPDNHWMNQHIRDYFYRSYQTLFSEAVEDDIMFEQSEAITSFGTIPLAVITAAYPNGAGFLGDKALQAEYLKIHAELQKNLLDLSVNSRQLMAVNSGHYVPLQDEALVIRTIKEKIAEHQTASL